MKDWVSIMVKDLADEIDREIMNELFGRYEKTDTHKKKLITGAFSALRHIKLHTNV